MKKSTDSTLIDAEEYKNKNKQRPPGMRIIKVIFTLIGRHKSLGVVIDLSD